MNLKNKNFRTIIFLLALLIVSKTVNAQTGNSPKEKVAGTFSGLVFSDIGKLTKAGTSSEDEKIIRIVAGGNDIWGKHDEFRFGYKKVKGDFDLSVKVISLTPADKYTKAGIMARVDLSDSSQHVFYQVFPDNTARNNNNGGCEFQYRSVKGADMKAIYPNPATAGNQFNVTFPDTWIRLKRKGNVFESYLSKDNRNWKLYSTFSLALPAELYVGLAVTSHNKVDYTTAMFSAMSVLK